MKASDWDDCHVTKVAVGHWTRGAHLSRWIQRYTAFWYASRIAPSAAAVRKRIGLKAGLAARRSGSYSGRDPVTYTSRTP